MQLKLNFWRIMSGGECCSGKGPGFANPMDAFKNSKKEKLLYIPCIVPAKDRPDYLVTIDVDENSADFGKVYSSFTSVISIMLILQMRLK